MKQIWKNKRVLIMGLGLHGGGLAAANYFLRQGARVTVTDLRSTEVLKPTLKKTKGRPVRYTLGRHDDTDFQNTDLVVQNPGVRNDSPFLKIARSHGAQIENEAGIFFQAAKGQLIGITGTKGKSTTTTLVGKILKQRWPDTIVAGNIRTTAMLDIVDKVKPSTRIVLELSSWQLEGLPSHRLSPPVALITNVLPDHLNRYRSFAHYRNTKGIIFQYQKKRGITVLNYDNAATRQLSRRVQSRLIWFTTGELPTTGEGAYVRDGWVRYGSRRRSAPVVPLAEVRLPGRHNLENVLAAVALTKSIGLSTKIIRAAVKQFAGLEHRLQTVRVWKGITFINDTTATAPVATSAAIEALAPRFTLHVIVGGQNKDLDYRGLIRDLRKKAAHVYLLPGTASDLIRRGLPKSIITLVPTMERAVAVAARNATAGAAIVLSPGAASFNLFVNEFDRAEHFIRAVQKLT